MGRSLMQMPTIKWSPEISSWFLLANFLLKNGKKQIYEISAHCIDEFKFKLSTSVKQCYIFN